MLSHPSGSVPPQIPHCKLILGSWMCHSIHSTSRLHRGISQPWHLLAMSLCFLVRLWQPLKMPWHLQTTPWHLQTTPGISWPHPGTSQTHLGPFWHLPALVAPCPAWKLCPVCPSFPGLSPFQPPKSQQGGKGLGSSPGPWVVRAGPDPAAQLSSEHSP